MRDLEDEIIYNRQLIASDVQRDYGSCREVLIVAGTDSARINTASRHYPSLAQFRSLYGSKDSHIKRCLGRLESTHAGSPRDFLPYFHLRAWDRPEIPADQRSGPFIRYVYEPLVQTFARETPQSAFYARLGSLFLPVTTIQGLEAKLPTAAPIDSLRFGRDIAALIVVPLSPEAVLQHAEFLIDFHFFYMLLDPFDSGLPISEEKLFAFREPVRDTGKDALRQTRNLLDIAIAQQTLLAGDAALPAMYDLFARQTDSASVEDRRRFKVMTDMLAANALLADNFVKYALWRDVKKNSNAMTYHVALGSDDPLMLSRATSLPWKFHFSADTVKERVGNNRETIKQAKGWSVKFGERYYELPTANALEDGKLQLPTALPRLLAVRDRVIDEIVTYEMMTVPSQTRRRAFNQVVLNTMGRVDKPIVPLR
jgi:hypothetical protein